MRKQYNDLSIVISVRIDSKERLENLKEVVRFLQMSTAIHIYIVEADVYRKVPDLSVEEQLFYMDADPVFYRTRYTNQALKRMYSPFIGIWDADVLLALRQLEEAMRLLRSGKAAAVVPYDGYCYDVPEEFRKRYLENGNIAFLQDNRRNFPLKFRCVALGGIFLVRREDYQQAGWENEHFYGWGHEDVERIKRVEILGAKLGIVEGPLYHLVHPRLANSVPFTQKQGDENRNELLKICRMDTVALKQYVASWNW